MITGSSQQHTVEKKLGKPYLVGVRFDPDMCIEKIFTDEDMTNPEVFYENWAYYFGGYSQMNKILKRGSLLIYFHSAIR